MPTEIADRDAGRQVRLDQSTNRIGDHDLPAMACGRNAGSPIDFQPAIVVTGSVRGPGVQADPDAKRDAGGPRVRGDRPLHRHGRTQRVVSIGEDDEERVSLGADLSTAVLGAGGTNECLMLSIDLVEAGTELLDEAHGAFHIRPEKGDRPGGQRADGVHWVLIRSASVDSIAMAASGRSRRITWTAAPLRTRPRAPCSSARTVATRTPSRSTASSPM